RPDYLVVGSHAVTSRFPRIPSGRARIFRFLPACVLSSQALWYARADRWPSKYRLKLSIHWPACFRSVITRYLGFHASQNPCLAARYSSAFSLAAGLIMATGMPPSSVRTVTVRLLPWFSPPHRHEQLGPRAEVQRSSHGHASCSLIRRSRSVLPRYSRPPSQA